MFADSRAWKIRVYKPCTGRLLSLSVLSFRKVVLEYSQVHKKLNDLLVCELVSFESVLCHCGHPRHPLQLSLPARASTPHGVVDCALYSQRRR